MTQRDDVSHVWTLIEEIAIAMVVTHSEGRQLRARPMAARPDAPENIIYFLTDAAAAKDDEIRQDENICLAFADVKKQRYLSVTGRGEVANDRAGIRRHWSRYDKAFWRDADDPAIRLLCVYPEKAELWERGGAVATLVKMIAARLAGEAPKLGENAKIASFGARRS